MKTSVFTALPPVWAARQQSYMAERQEKKQKKTGIISVECQWSRWRRVAGFPEDLMVALPLSSCTTQSRPLASVFFQKHQTLPMFLSLLVWFCSVQTFQPQCSVPLNLYPDLLFSLFCFFSYFSCRLSRLQFNSDSLRMFWCHKDKQATNVRQKKKWCSCVLIILIRTNLLAGLEWAWSRWHQRTRSAFCWFGSSRK